jgi:hypothetical protein
MGTPTNLCESGSPLGLAKGRPLPDGKLRRGGILLTISEPVIPAIISLHLNVIAGGQPDQLPDLGWMFPLRASVKKACAD